MTPDYARVMARCNRWMNEKLYAVAEELTDEERKRDRGAFSGSIHRTLNHLLLADRVWLGRFTGASCTPTSPSSAASARRRTPISMRFGAAR